MSKTLSSLAPVYSFDPTTGTLHQSFMHVPGRSKPLPPTFVSSVDTLRPLTLGVDTEGLIDEVIIRRGMAVYFIVKPSAGRLSTEATLAREHAIRQARKQVRNLEIRALELEAATRSQNKVGADSVYVFSLVQFAILS